MGDLRERIAETIAKSRYEMWNATGMPWEEYREVNPAVAEGIYLDDGRRDAEQVILTLTEAGVLAGVV